MVSLLVDTDSFLEAGAQARTVTQSVEHAMARAVSGFSGSHQMGGSDQNGAKWARSYDEASSKLFTYVAQLQDASSTLSRKLDVTGAYYELVELANAGVPDASLTLPAPIVATSCPYIPSAVGGQRTFPNPNPAFEWIAEQISNLIGDMWPDGDTDKLNHASTVWHRLADDLDDASTSLKHVTESLVGLDTPELSQVHDEVAQLRSFAKKVATACRELGKACNDLSGQIAHVHLQTEITVGIAITAIGVTAAAALGLTPFTFGISDAVGAGAVAGEVAGAVGTISGFIADLAAMISTGIGTIAASTAGLVGISADLAASIGVTVGDISASAVLWGVAGAGEDVIVTSITQPGTSLVDAAEDGFVGGFIGGGIGGTFGRALTIIRGNQIKLVIPGRIDKTISLRDYQIAYLQSLHNVDADSIMLGKYEQGGPTGYIAKAGDDHTYFSLGADWDAIKAAHGLTNEDMFKLFNTRFLQEGIDEGKVFHFSHPPEDDPLSLGAEYHYLLDHGYEYDAVTMTASPK